MRKLALLVAGLLLVAAPAYIGVASAQKTDPNANTWKLLQDGMNTAYKPAAPKADKKAVKKKAKKKAKKAAKKPAKKPAKKADDKKKT